MDELSPERQLLISIIRQAAKDLESKAGANYRQAKAWIQAENGFFDHQPHVERLPSHMIFLHIGKYQHFVDVSQHVLAGM